MQEIRQLRMQLPDFKILCAVWHSKSRYLQAGGLDYGYDDDAKILAAAAGLSEVKAGQLIEADL